MYINPYENLKNPGTFYKTNFHTHAGTGPNTCGANDLMEVIHAYRQAGYTALTISNHDLFTHTEGLCEGVTLIHGVEYSANPHMLTLGVEEFFNMPHQEAIDRANEADGFAVLCHPNWGNGDHWPQKMMESLSGYLGIEVLNPLVYRLHGSGLAADRWDRLLSQGRRIWGFGNDDFHIWADLGRACNMIWAADSAPRTIINAVKAGCFYVSSGLHLESLLFDGETVTFRAKPAVPSYIDTYCYTITGAHGKILATATGREISYRLSDEPYIRLQAMSENGAMLFLQPIYRADAFGEK